MILKSFAIGLIIGCISPNVVYDDPVEVPSPECDYWNGSCSANAACHLYGGGGQKSCHDCLEDDESVPNGWTVHDSGECRCITRPRNLLDVDNAEDCSTQEGYWDDGKCYEQGSSGCS